MKDVVGRSVDAVVVVVVEVEERAEVYWRAVRRRGRFIDMLGGVSLGPEWCLREELACSCCRCCRCRCCCCCC